MAICEQCQDPTLKGLHTCGGTRMHVDDQQAAAAAEVAFEEAWALAEQHVLEHYSQDPDVAARKAFAGGAAWAVILMDNAIGALDAESFVRFASAVVAAAHRRMHP